MRLRCPLAVLARTWAAATAWGLLGAMMGILFRAAAPAIGVGIGYTLVGESLILLVWRDGQSWLPGQILSVFVAGGTPAVDLGLAALLLSFYMAAFCIVGAVVFKRRDVSS